MEREYSKVNFQLKEHGIIYIKKMVTFNNCIFLFCGKISEVLFFILYTFLALLYKLPDDG
jgi:hypothetical protein